MSNYRRILFFLVSSVICVMHVGAQIKIHAHNDYEQTKPLWNALEHKADFIEVDVFPVDGTLLVAHAEKELKNAGSLEKMYLLPLQQLFASKDTAIIFQQYGRFSLFIDMKMNAHDGLPILYNLMDKYAALKKSGLKIVISGDRGPIQEWKNAPDYILFDGRPHESYDNPTLERVAMISDSYWNHLKIPNLFANSKIRAFVRHADSLGKPCRLWGAPDNKRTWKRFVSLGVGIVNTNKIAGVRDLFPE